MQNETNTESQKTPCQNKTAIAQLAKTFGNDVELFDLFDDLINRIIQAYSGVEQELSFLAGDCDFLHQLKKAVKADLSNENL